MFDLRPPAASSDTCLIPKGLPHVGGDYLEKITRRFIAAAFTPHGRGLFGPEHLNDGMRTEFTPRGRDDLCWER